MCTAARTDAIGHWLNAPVSGLPDANGTDVSSQASRMLLVVEGNGPGFGRLPEDFGLGLSVVTREALEHPWKTRMWPRQPRRGQARLWLPLTAPRLGEIADATCHL
jgi:hypothetical protein